MTTEKANQPKSIFDAIDKHRDTFVDDEALANGFTRMVLLRDTGDLPENVMHVHMEEPTKYKDPDTGEMADRYYTIWSEGENEQLFGAWFFSHADEDGFPDTEERVYPRMITSVTKKSRQIWEDVYSLDSNGMPIAWVTYHNSQQ
jgi:hypothetical protein